MDELFLYIVVGASLVIIGAIWIKLRLDNSRQEKLIKKYLTDLRLIKAQNNQP